MKSADKGSPSRRQIIQGGIVIAGGLAVAPLLPACDKKTDGGMGGGGGGGAGGGGGKPVIKIGFVSPRTGPAAGFGEPDGYVLELVRKAFAAGLVIGGKEYAVTVIDKDGQSNPQRSAQVANELITSEQVDLMLTTSTPETINPVSDACEAAGVPCISTVAPWEAWYFGRGAKPGAPSPFKFSYHFCFGVEQFFNAFTHMWPQVETNKKVAVMWPNDADGNAIRAMLGPKLVAAGYTIIDPGAYTDGTNDYSSQIAKFKAEKCEIFDTFPIPPDFATFWQQAAQQGFKPKVAQVSKTGLFASQIEVLGPNGKGIAATAYWAPSWPYKSALTNIDSKQLGDGYTAASGKQWNQQLGPSLALFDVAAALLKGTTDPKDRAGVAKTLSTLEVATTVGKIAFGKGPVANVAVTPILGGQWVAAPAGSKFPLEFVFCENSSDPNVPVGAKLASYV